MSSRSSSRTSPAPGSRSPSPVQSLRRSPSPRPISRNRTPQSSSIKSRKSQSSKKSQQLSISTPIIYQLDIVDCVLVFLSLFFFFVTFTVPYSNINDEKLDLKLGLQRFYLILVLILIIALVVKKKLKNTNKL